MALPPSLAGAVQETVADALPAEAETRVGAPGAVSTGTGMGATGVTLVEGAEAALEPIALVATTVKVYAVPLVRPVNVADVPATVALAPAGVDVTVYVVIALPPSLAGAVQETSAEALPAEAVTAVGA